MAVVGNFATAEILPVLEDRFGRLKDSFPGTPSPGRIKNSSILMKTGSWSLTYRPKPRSW